MDPEPMPPTPTADVPVTQSDDLPEGWSTAVSPIDGRVYYWNSTTGETSWKHPNAPGATAVPPPPTPDVIEAVPSIGDYSGIIAARSTRDLEEGSPHTNYSAMTEKGAFRDYDPNQAVINSYRCLSFFAFILFPPLGIIALCRSCCTRSKYHQGRYETAHEYSQQTLMFSRISIIMGVGLWGYLIYCYFAGPGPYVFEIPMEWWPTREV